MIKGQTRQILLPPQVEKNDRDIEVVLPRYKHAYNGRLTDGGKWQRRPGYSEAWDVGVDNRIIGLIPEGVGYALTDLRTLYQLTATPTLLTGTLTGTGRPTWTNLNGQIILADGGLVKAVNTATSALDVLAGNPPSGKWIDMVDNYVLVAGHNNYEFQWCQVANSAIWPAANFNAVLRDGDPLQFMKVFNRMIYFWKGYSLETWVDIGGTTIFARTNTVNLIDKGRQQGRGVVGDSIVQANGTFYFLMDGLFHKLEGLQPKVISQPYRAELAGLANIQSMIGFDYRKEHCIAWFDLVGGRCFVHDYYYNLWSEDNLWSGSGWQRVPTNAYMELNGGQYIGDYGATGKIYKWSRDYETDDGAPLRVYRRFTVPLASERTEGRQHRVNRLRWRMERGHTDDGDEPTVEIQTGFDGVEPLQSADLSMGALGDRTPIVDMHGLGVGHDMDVAIIESEPTASLITDGWLTAEALGV